MHKSASWKSPDKQTRCNAVSHRANASKIADSHASDCVRACTCMCACQSHFKRWWKLWSLCSLSAEPLWCRTHKLLDYLKCETQTDDGACTFCTRDTGTVSVWISAPATKTILPSRLFVLSACEFAEKYTSSHLSASPLLSGASCSSMQGAPCFFCTVILMSAGHYFPSSLFIYFLDCDRTKLKNWHEAWWNSYQLARRYSLLIALWGQTAGGK